MVPFRRVWDARSFTGPYGSPLFTPGPFGADEPGLVGGRDVPADRTFPAFRGLLGCTQANPHDAALEQVGGGVEADGGVDLCPHFRGRSSTPCPDGK